MKSFIVFFPECLILCFSHHLGAHDSFFALSPGKVEKAIQYGTNADYKLNEFGGYDMGLNKFSLGNKTGYIDLLTPFVRITSFSLKNEEFRKEVILWSSERTE
jgi:hypothetical protein